MKYKRNTLEKRAICMAFERFIPVILASGHVHLSP